MKFKSYYKKYLFIFIIFVIFAVFYCMEDYENADISVKTRTLKKDGFCVLYNPNYSIHTIDYPCDELKRDVLKILPPNYVFIDYIYKINNTSLSTFHRDVTSSQHIFNTKFPIYTLILYQYDGELLSVCPNSHKTYPFVWSKILNIDGKSGTAFLFDCDLLHAGRTNHCKERKVIQYKICHQEDLEKLSSLQNIYVEKTEKCINNIYSTIQRKLSYFFEMPINYIAYPFMIKRENPNTFIGMIQYFIPLNFYNNI
jgi:hypothetical protein